MRLLSGLNTGWAEGKPVVDALRSAKVTALRDGARPVVWALLAVMGDPMVVVRLRKPAAPVGW